MMGMGTETQTDNRGDYNSSPCTSCRQAKQGEIDYSWLEQLGADYGTAISDGVCSISMTNSIY